jgi:hypothetical protein
MTQGAPRHRTMTLSMPGDGAARYHSQQAAGSLVPCSSCCCLCRHHRGRQRCRAGDAWPYCHQHCGCCCCCWWGWQGAAGLPACARCGQLAGCMAVGAAQRCSQRHLRHRHGREADMHWLMVPNCPGSQPTGTAYERLSRRDKRVA